MFVIRNHPSDPLKTIESPVGRVDGRCVIAPSEPEWISCPPGLARPLGIAMIGTLLPLGNDNNRKPLLIMFNRKMLTAVCTVPWS